jgi:hypothetical protein
MLDSRTLQIATLNEIGNHPTSTYTRRSVSTTMIWRITARGGGQHEVVTETNVGGMKQSCGVTSDPLTEIESFICMHAQPNDMVHYPDGRVARISGMALA